METLALAPGLAQAIVDHARRGFPCEVCGLIAGRQGQGRYFFPAQNVAATPRTRFEMDVETLAKQLDFADQDLELVAIYHSHPQGPETPSQVDVAQAFYPSSIYIICSLAEPDAPVIRGFRIQNGVMWEVGLRKDLDRRSTID